MTRLEAAAVGAVLLGIVMTPFVARSSEPAAFQAEYPDRDVLNGGALTPWGAAQRGARNAYGAMDNVNPTGCLGHRSYDAASGTFLGRDGRRHPCR